MADAPNIIELTAGVVASYVGRNVIAPNDLPNLLKTVYGALNAVGEAMPEEAPAPAKLTPAQIRRSVTHDGIRSFEDGRMYKSMKRHLAGRSLTPAQYREKWGLPKDYAMVSPAYSASRSALAKALGLGRKADEAAPRPPKPVGPPSAAAAAKKPPATRKPRAAKAAKPERPPGAIAPKDETFT